CFASSLVPVSASSLYHLFCSLRSLVCLLLRQHPPRSALFPYTTLFRSLCRACPPRSASSVPTEPSSTPIRPSTRPTPTVPPTHRSEEHTSELQSRFDLVCRLLLEKKKSNKYFSRCIKTMIRMTTNCSH